MVFADRASRQLMNLIRATDVVHCQNPCVDVALLAKLFRKTLILTIHNYHARRQKVRDLLRSLAFELADARWYNSDFVWRTWEPACRLATSGKLPVVSNLPTGRVPPSERKGFIFVARWIANKGLDTLIDAYAAARIDRIRWPLRLCGDGPLRPAIERRIADLGVDGIEILGKVDEGEKNDAIRHARWMVTPPRTNEDLGLTPIEARHVGVPCIITRDGGLPEAAGKFALSCEPGDVAALSGLLEAAAAMTEPEYEHLCEATYDELIQSLQPLSVYLDHYRQIFAASRRTLKSHT